MTRKQLLAPEPKPSSGRLTKEEMLAALIDRWETWLADARTNFEHGFELEVKHWLDENNDVVYAALEGGIFKWLERHKDEVVQTILEGTKFSMTPPSSFWPSLMKFMKTNVTEPEEPAPPRHPLSEPPIEEDPTS